MASAFPPVNFHYLVVPTRQIFIATTDKGICNLNFVNNSSRSIPNSYISKQIYLLHPLLQHLINELENYFAGKIKSFTVPIDLHGTDFQNKVWSVVAEIPLVK